MAVTASFPAWLTRNKGGAYLVDTHKAYPLFLKALGLKHDQYGLEVTYQCVKMAVQDLVSASGQDPRDEGKPLVILMEPGRDKDKWALRSAPAGKGAALATQGREARVHYDRIRGKV
jgi:hypothetical protein